VPHHFLLPPYNFTQLMICYRFLAFLAFFYKPQYQSAMKNDYTDRRRFARLDLALTVSYRVVDQLGTTTSPESVVSSDVSLGGLRLMTPGPLEHGTKLEIDIFLPEDEKHPIKANGEVVWQSKISTTSYETGVVIRGINDADKKRFMEFVFDQMSRMVTAT